MQYSKPPLTFDAQANLLLARGLQGDKQKLITCLKSVSYYRLSAYLYPYRQSDDTFSKDTTFDLVWKHYVFHNRVFAILTILRYMLKYAAPTSHWEKRLLDLLAKYPEVSIQSMGFPLNWEESPLWK